MSKQDNQSEILINNRLDLILSYYKRRTQWAQDEHERLQGEINTLDGETYEMEKEVKDVSKQLEDFMLLEVLDDDRPSDKVRTEIDELDMKLESIDSFLTKKQYQEQNIARMENISKEDLIKNQLSKNNTAAFEELRGNLRVLGKRLEDIGIKE